MQVTDGFEVLDATSFTISGAALIRVIPCHVGNGIWRKFMSRSASDEHWQPIHGRGATLITDLTIPIRSWQEMSIFHSSVICIDGVPDQNPAAWDDNH